MKISLTVQTKIDDWKIAKEAEDLGYDAVWFPDSQMIWSDCYATMALAAQSTSTIKIGTGVAIPGTRIAPVTAHSIASINHLAPGRTFLGIGTGHTAMRTMGMNPMPLKEFGEYLRVVRTLLAGDEVDYSLRGKTKNIQFMHQDLGFRNTDDHIPIYVAANGPKALALAGQYGDGLISAGAENPDLVAYNVGAAREGAKAAGRAIGDDYHVTSLSNALVLRPGEKLTDDRVIDATGSWVVALIHFVYEIYELTKNEEAIPEFMQPIWEEYHDYVGAMAMPEAKRFRQVHNGHCTFYPPEERRFITPEMIQGSHLIGQPEEIVDQIRKAEAKGLDEISLLPPMAVFRESMHDFKAVLERL